MRRPRIPFPGPDRGSALLHLAGGALVFLVWRLTGQPSPGTLGRLVPLAWVLTGLMAGRRRARPETAALLFLHIVLSLLWTASPAAAVLAAASALLGVVPGLMQAAGGRLGLLRAALPLAPLLLLTVPFSGDEPHYAAITERLVDPASMEFLRYSHQPGDPSAGVTHHQPLFPALLAPGLPLGAPGLRAVSLLFAVAAAALLASILRGGGVDAPGRAGLLALLLVPGSSILGMVYPGWLALLILLAAVSLRERGLLGTALVVVAAGLLVAVKFRFAGISLGLGLALYLRSGGRTRLLVPLVLLGGAGLVLAADALLLDGSFFWVRYGNPAFVRTVVSHLFLRVPDVALGLVSMLLDIEAGLLWKAPWVLAALAGLPLLRREHPGLFRWLGLPALAYALTLVVWVPTDWPGMPTPACRMLLPLAPVLVASLAGMWDRRGVRALVWASLAITAIQAVYPAARFNSADGSDVLTGLLTGTGTALGAMLPSAVRPDPAAYLLWGILAAALVIALSRRGRGVGALLLAGALAGGTLAGRSARMLEAEDLPESHVSFCRPYPEKFDPVERRYWLFSREMMLRLSHPLDAVAVPVPPGEGDVTAEVRFRALQEGPEPPALVLGCGAFSDTLRMASRVLESPGWLAYIVEMEQEEVPENLEELRVRVSVPAGLAGDTLRLGTMGAPDAGGLHGIYLDEVGAWR